MNIYIARHGENVDNMNRVLNGHRDLPLTLRGVEQAKHLALMIKDSGVVFDVVYSSPLKRAYDTGRIITDVLGMKKPKVLEDIIERDFGIMTGKPATKEYIVSVCEDEVVFTDEVTYFVSPLGAETFVDLMNRSRKVIDYLESKYRKDQNILLTCHGDIGKMLYAEYYGLEWRSVLEMFHFGNSDLLHISRERSPDDVHIFKNSK